MFLPSFMLPSREALDARERERERMRALPTVAWSPTVKWEPVMHVDSATYPVVSLFDVPAHSHCHPDKIPPGASVESPAGDFLYHEQILPKGAPVQTFNGRRKGFVLFDGDVRIPTLNARAFRYEASRWHADPWMSLTPMEYLTLRPGTKLAKGRVIVAGLGLGHQLIEVSKRTSVTSLVLVERSRDLVNWLLPRITPHLSRPLDDVIVGDAFTVMPDLEADVALVDVFPNYGHNHVDAARLKRACKRIARLWAWGTAKTGE